MIKCKLSVSCAALMGMATYQAEAAPWVKSYVVGDYNFAFRFGGLVSPLLDSVHQ